MSTRDNFEEKSPNGVLRQQIEREKAISNALEKEKELLKIRRQQEEVETRIRTLQEKGTKLSEEEAKYLKELKEERVKIESTAKLEEDRFEKLKKSVESTHKISLEAAKKEAEALREKKELEEAANKEFEKSIALLEDEKKAILRNNDLSYGQKKKELEEIDKKIADKRKESGKDPTELKSSKLAEDILSGLGGEKSIGGSLLSLAGNKTGAGSAIDLLSDALPDLDPLEGAVEGISNTTLKGVSTLVDVGATVKLISQGLNALRQSMTQSINQAASTIESYYGRIQAGLEGSGIDYYKIAEDVEESLGFSRLVKQTDYLNKIADLTSQGLVTDVEQRALLQTIKDKTLTSFDVANAGLTRLVRLGEQNSINQFGVELQLKRLLNSRLFGDASYLQGMFDSVTSAILDSSVVTKGDITNFNSTVQTWLGAMYASGLSDNVVSSIASGINALGSGNVSALANDESIQRLFLLSMDRIGMDYADILQQGLSSEDTHKLLSAVVELLNEIAGNTEDNLVLKSSYSNLFNLSVSDMQAIQNVYSKMSSIQAINSSQAQSLTLDAVANKVAENTFVSEKWDNLFKNFSYSFGSNVANNDTMYSVYRIADITYDILDTFSQAGGVLGKALNAAKLVPAITQFGIGGISMINMLGNISSFSNDSLLGLLGPLQGGSEGSGYYSTTGASTNSGFKTFKTTMASTIETSQASVSDWGKEEEDEVLGILKELSKTLMKLKEGNGYAFAVSVEGMNNEVLRSFASIFADEDAMLATFTGDNNVLNKALFDYFDDTTSNSTEAVPAGENTVQA